MKADCHDSLERFFQTYGAMDKLVYDGVKEQVIRKTEFKRVVRKYDIRGHSSKKPQSNQNSFKGCIRELRRRWYRTMLRTYLPR